MHAKSATFSDQNFGKFTFKEVWQVKNHSLTVPIGLGFAMASLSAVGDPCCEPGEADPVTSLLGWFVVPTKINKNNLKRCFYDDHDRMTSVRLFITVRPNFSLVVASLDNTVYNYIW